MKKILLLTVCLIGTFVSLNAQKNTDKRIEMIKSFLADFYTKPVSGQVLSEKYIYFPSYENYSYTMDQRITMVGGLANKVREITQSRYREKEVEIVPFSQLPVESRVEFSEKIQKDVYAIRVKDDVLFYICFYEDRILSFFYFKDVFLSF